MSETVNKLNSPELRFNEFTKQWEEKYLGSFMNFKNGINAEKSQYGSGIKFINVLDIIDNRPIMHDQIIGKVDIPKNVFEKNKVIYGDVLFQRSSETRKEAGQSNIYLDKNKFATFGGFVIRGRPKINFNPIFFNYLLKTSSLRKEITTKSGGSTRFNVGQKSLSSVLINVSTEESEQHKIADFLSSVDEKFEALKYKHDLLEKFKRGILQKIFSHEIRFLNKKGKKFAKWEEKKLGDVIKDVSEYSETSNQYEILSSTINGIYPQSEYFNKVIASKDNTGYKLLRKDQIVLSPQNLWLGNINLNNKFDIGIVSPSYKIFSINQDAVLIEYMKNLIKTPRMLYEYKNASEQGASVVRRNLDIDLFLSIKIYIPSVSEQERIADFLSGMDEKISTLENQINQMQTFKIGLLQQMFV